MADDNKARIAEALMMPNDPPRFLRNGGINTLRRESTGVPGFAGVPGGHMTYSPLAYALMMLGQVGSRSPEQVDQRMRRQMEEAQSIADMPRVPY